MTRVLRLGPGNALTNRSLIDDGRVGALLALLNRDGEEARVVGGAVRNALIDLAPGDIDITTTATPDAVMARAKAARLRVIPTGVEHGTVTVVVRGLPFEVTTLREDVETDGRHAVVRFGRDFAEDARRRDFTINGLSLDAEGIVHDYTDGLADLEAGRVCFIGDPSIRIREDYLRVLRFFRFSASYAIGPLDPEGLAACAANAGGLARLSRERVRAELFKLLEARGAAVAVRAMATARVLTALLGDRNWPERQARLVMVESVEDWPADALRALAALAVKTPPDALRLREHLRLSNLERDRLLRLAEIGQTREGRPIPPDALGVLALLHSVGRQNAFDTILLDHVDSGSPPEDAGWRQAARQAASVRVPTLPVSGSDLLARGLRSGPQLGAVLKDVQARWVRAGFPAEPSALRRLIDQALVAAGGGTGEAE